MTNLFRSLVERSVRAPSVAFADQVSQSPEGAPGEAARDAPGAMIIPKRRSRYEPALGEAIEFAEAAPSAPAADTPRDGPAGPAAVRGAPADVAAPVARAPARPAAAPRPAFDEPHHRTSVASTPQSVSQPTLPAAPADTPAVATVAEGAAVRDRDPAAPPPPTPPARERAPAVVSVASVTPAPLEQSSGDGVAPARPPTRHPSTARVAASPAVAQAEPAITRSGELAPVRQRDPVRAAARASDATGARAPADRPAAPRVQVSIGRVEVRAVYAPPPAPARARPSVPTMSLDDYLKQRETG